MELNQTRIEDAIVAEVADKMVCDDTLWDRVKVAVDARINRHFSDVADERIRSAVELAISEGFERTYFKVNSYGQRDGEPTSIRKELERLIGDYWNATVGRDGKPSSGYGNTLTRAEWMITQLVAADFQGEIKQHIINLGGSLKDKLRSELHHTVNQLLSEVFKVRSAEDQKLTRHDSSIISPPAAPAA